MILRGLREGRNNVVERKLPYILVVDDDTDARVILATILTSHGYRVVTAAAVATGLRLAEKHHPALILLDVSMPKEDGFTFRQKQRAMPEIAAIPVICITGLDDPAALAGKMDAVALLPKPFDIDALLGVVMSHVPLGVDPQLSRS